MKILLGVTNSVAASLVPKIVKKLQGAGCWHEVEIVATPIGKENYFWNPKSVDAKVWTEEDEWCGEKYDPDQLIRHIELRDWADILLMAPLTANTMAKMANGMCDNLLTSVVRAWDMEKPIVLAPAMNTKMWEHPVALEHLEKIKSWGNVTVVGPVSKKLACGDYGIGALAHIDDIARAVNMLEMIIKGRK